MGRYTEGSCSQDTIVRNIAKLVTHNGTDSEWILRYPSSLTDVLDFAVIEKNLEDTERTKSVFLCIERCELDYKSKENQNYVNISIGTGFNLKDVDLEDKSDRDYAWPIDRYANFYTRSSIARLYWSNSDRSFDQWSKIFYKYHFGKGYFQLVLQSFNNVNTGGSFTSAMYVGQIDLFKDCSGNVYNSQSNYPGAFGFFVTSELNEVSDKFGNRTSNGVSTFCMLETQSGIPMQQFNFAFNTHDELLDRGIEGPGKWINSYAVSKIFLFNAVEGYAGSLRNTFAINLMAVVPGRDKKMVNEDKESLYTVYKIDSKYSPFLNSPNVLSGIAFLKEGEEYQGINTEPITDFSQWTYCKQFEIKGTIFNEESGLTIDGCTVKIFNEKFSGESISLPNGSYSIKGLPYGLYSVEVYDKDNNLCYVQEIEIIDLLTVLNIQISYSWIEFDVYSVLDVIGSSPEFGVRLLPFGRYVNAKIKLQTDYYVYSTSKGHYRLSNVNHECSTKITAEYNGKTAEIPITILDPQHSNQYLPPIDVVGNMLVLDIWDFADVDLDTIRITRNGEIVVNELVSTEDKYRVYLRDLVMGENIIKFEGMRSYSGDVSVAMNVFDHAGKEMINYMTQSNKFIVQIAVDKSGIQEEPYPSLIWKVTRRR